MWEEEYMDKGSVNPTKNVFEEHVEYACRRGLEVYYRII